MNPESRCRIMAPRVRMLWVLGVLGMLGMLCPVGEAGEAAPCPPPCACPPAGRALSCRGCPSDYLTVGGDTLSLSVSGCKDILYLLRLHRPLPPDKPAARGGRFALETLQITDSFMEKIPESYVNGDYDIRSIVMSNNSIRTIDAGLEARNLTVLDLSNNKLSYVKNGTFERMNNIVFLNLGSNRIENMSVQAFDGLSKLVHLDLSNNNLTCLMDAVFLPIVSLQRLNLSFNRLQVLSEKCFGNLLLLQQLDISYNRLTSVAPGTLQFLPNLAKLLLADNPQLRPDAQIFVGTGRRLQQVDASRTGLRRVPEALTHSVRYLSLAGNRISTLRCGDLDGYPLLHMLDFSDNIIENVEDDALGRLEMISRLYLNRNKLKTVPKMLPDKLTYLSLDMNLVSNLTTADFATSGSLKVLLLSNNRISYVQENAFVLLISLEVLDISNNPLKALTPNTFGGPVSLKDLRIAYVDISPPARDISFPVPSPEGIESLHLQHSPGLAKELMADTAALAAMARLQYLDLSYSNITNIRSDLLHFLPQLKTLRLEGNRINCSELNWLADWMRENLEDELKTVKCFSPAPWTGKYIIDLPKMKKPTNDRVAKATTQPPIRNVRYYTSLKPITLNNNNDTINARTLQAELNTRNVSDGNVSITYNNTETTSHKDLYISNNLTKQADIPKINQIDRTDHIKSLLDFQDNEQHHMIFKPTKKTDTQEQSAAGQNKNVQKEIDLQPTISEKKSPEALIQNPELSGEADRGSKTKKINKLASVKSSRVNMSDKSELIEIFSQLSHKENNSANASERQKTNSETREESVSLCIATGNLNGTENKTECSQHPEAVPVHSETRENKNIKNERIIYRKNGNDQSVVIKPRKIKLVSRPNERYNASSAKNAQRDSRRRDETAIKTHQRANETRVIESLDPLVLKHGHLYQHDLLGPTLARTASSDAALSLSLAVAAGRRPATPQSATDSPGSAETSANGKRGDNENKIKDVKTTSRVNTKIKEIGEKENNGSSAIKFSEHQRENVSEYQTSRFRADANGGQSGLGLGALVGVCGAACAALAGACLARRRPLSRRGQGGPEMMEVQTITAVGELW